MLAPFRAEIAGLKKALAAAEGLTMSSTKALAAFRSDPAMKAIDPKVRHVSGPVLADPVPRNVAGEAKPFFKPDKRAARREKHASSVEK